jgi:hypothetical protein
MELNDLKSAWHEADESSGATKERLLFMLQEKNHPVLRKVRRQLIIETAGWLTLLGAYYTMFDADKKPLWANILLIISILMSIIHNVTGYTASRHIITGNTIKQSLENYLSRLKRYSVVSVVSRLIFGAGLLAFFSSGINFTANKYTLLAILILAVLFQCLLLYRVWVRRLRRIGDTIKSFTC